MSEWTEHDVKVDDLTIHYYRSGDSGKQPIILLHGVMDNGLCWTPVARDLQERYDVIMTDARGHGHTGGDLAIFSYPRLAADVAGLIRALDLEQPYLWGHSMGAMTSAIVAADYPELVRAAVLEDPPFMDAPDQRTGEEPATEIIQMFQGILRLKGMSPDERLVAARTFNPIWDEVELGPWADSKVEFNPEVFQHLEQIIPWRDYLPRISCPVQLVIGDPQAHAIVSPQLAQEAASLWQHGEILQIQGAGHCIHRDRYAATVPQVLNFLSRV